MNLEYAARTAIGDRAENEDFHSEIIKKEGALFAVMDGLGGHRDGELASRYFSEGLNENLDAHLDQLQVTPEQAMKNLITTATKSMVVKLKKDHCTEARTTCAVVWLDAEKIIIAHVGDSRVYFFRQPQKVWRTRDHSLVQQFVDSGLLREDEMAHHPQQNIILQTIAADEKPNPEVTLFPALRKGELLLLCTDGFWEQIIPTEMINLLNAPKLDQALENLVQQAMQRAAPKSDNVTAIAMRCRR